MDSFSFSESAAISLGEYKSADIKFFSIDAAENDLPWQFTALSVPTVLFFPAINDDNNATTMFDRSDTRIFPANKQFTVTNLLNFILVNLPLSSRTQLALNLCDDRCKETTKAVIEKQIQESNEKNDWDDVYQDNHKKLFRLNHLNKMLKKQKSNHGKIMKTKYWSMTTAIKDEL